MKKERGTSFLRQPKTGTNVTSKFSSSSSSFLSIFSLTPIGVFVCLVVCLFVCLRAREEAYVKYSFSSLYNTFFLIHKKCSFCTQFAHYFCTQFAHYFCTQICGLCCTKTSPFLGIKMQKTKHKIERMRTQKQTLSNEKQTF